MIENIWATYGNEQFEAAFRQCTAELVQHAGVDLIHIAGMSLMQLRHYDQGIILLKAAAALRPSEPYIYVNAAFMVEQLGLPDELAYFTQLGLRDFPNDANLQQQAANVALLKQDYPAAIAAYTLLEQRDANDKRTHINLGSTYRILGEFAKSEAHFAKAAAIDPDHTPLRVARGALFGEMGRLDEAVAELENVQDWDAKLMLGMLYLSRGDYARGWALYRDRWHSLEYRNTSKPSRPFEHLDQIVGKRVAVLREGGFGDVFQFIRYIPMLAAQAKHVLFHPMASEARLLQANLPDNVDFITASNTTSSAWSGRIPADYDYTIALLDLPRLYGTTVETIPATIPYMHVPAGERERRRLPPTEKKRVGLVWAGGHSTGLNQRSYDAQRSIPLPAFEGLREFAAEIEFCNLQFGDRAKDSGLTMTTVLAEGFDWLDTAAIIEQMDLVVSVDTAVVHLAAALGKPTWLLSRFNPCWRWLRNRETSPWYPNVVRVFGQTTYGDWTSTIADLRCALETWLHP